MGSKKEDISIETLIKTEEAKLVTNPRFDALASKYWGLLIQKDEDGSIGYETYSHLLKNINIALLPHYKDKKMDKELQEEWELDS